jgi:peptidoglycan/xylan/chitin deacetylase (PgdA/CDA1 family)
MKLKITLLLVLCAIATACSKPSAKQINDDIGSSLVENEKAKTQADWEASDKNPETLLEKWKTGNAAPEDVCAGFKNKSPKDLALFEEQIKSKEYQTLLAPCKEQLLKTLEEYWKQQRENLKQQNGGFKFQDNEKKIDFTNGYKTASADLGKKEVALSFDDGPHPEYTQRILDALESVNAKAVFFEVGHRVDAHPELTRLVGSKGHTVGSHSIDHKCLGTKPRCAVNNKAPRVMTLDEATTEIRGGHQSVYNALGWVDPFFRFPFGESSPELAEYLKERQTGQFYWSVDSEDWKNTTAQEMIDKTLRQVDQRSGGLILFHDVQRKTAESLPTILKQLYFKGYSLVLLKSANPDDRYKSKLVKLKN